MAKKHRALKPVPTEPVLPPTIFGRQMSPVKGYEDSCFSLDLGRSIGTARARIMVTKTDYWWEATVQSGRNFDVTCLEDSPQVVATKLERELCAITRLVDRLTRKAR